MTSEEMKALAKFSQTDFEHLMKQRHDDPTVTDPAEIDRALGNGKLSLDWMEQWLFLNNKGNQGNENDYVNVAGEPKLNQPDTSYSGTDIYDIW